MLIRRISRSEIRNTQAKDTWDSGGIEFDFIRNFTLASNENSKFAILFLRNKSIDLENISYFSNVF